MGFGANLYTYFSKNKKGEVYLFVYEYKFMKLKESTSEKYILIQWQDYMNKAKKNIVISF